MTINLKYGAATRRSAVKTLARTAGFLMAVFASAGLFIATADAQGISNTKHNLTTTGPGPNKSDATDICVFCHTPHGSDTSASAPLWNRVLPNPASFQTYDDLGTSTLDGTVLSVGSVSLACLSCHDGSQALDTVLNAPGSGNFNSAGVDMGVTWDPGNTLDPDDSLGAGITNLGTDLRDDHPVGVQYGGFLVGGNKIDPDFKDVTKHPTLDRWWVDTAGGTAGQRDKTDMILYTRSNGGTDQPFVECASCHDPHSDTNPTFLRIANSSSAVCLACHVK